MIEYIYIVKCPNCEDEHFHFFDEAKSCAMGCISSKPIITQVEVERNDFGECTDHCDLGTVWSWEDAIGKESDAEPTCSVFTKDDLRHMAAGEDPEFDSLDNSVDFEIDEISDFRKSIPEGMTIEQLVEEMEENEDTVECTWCEDLFDKSECRKEVNLGWLCGRCQSAIMSRGESLTFREGNYWDFLDEEVEPVEEAMSARHAAYVMRLDPMTKAELDKRLHSDYDMVVFCGDPSEPGIKSRDILAAYRNGKYIISFMDLTDKDTYNAAEVQATFDTIDGLWSYILACMENEDFYPEYHYIDEDLTENANHDALDKQDLVKNRPGEDDSENQADLDKENPEDKITNTLDEAAGSTDSLLETLEDSDSYRARLETCPECGSEQAFDKETDFCINCGFTL